MNKRMQRKLAYYIVACSFNYEVGSTYDILESMGVEPTMEEAERITDLASEVFERFAKKSEGWERMVKRKSEDE